MIPCPVCLQVLDGGGGRCRAHERWRTFRVWILGDWKPREEIAQEARAEPRKGIRSSSQALVGLYASHRTMLNRAAVAALEREQVPRLEGYVFLGFRHFRRLEGVDRSSYGTSIEAAVLAALLELRVLRSYHQLAGVTHLFYDLDDDDNVRGVETPREPGLQLWIGELPPAALSPEARA